MSLRYSWRRLTEIFLTVRHLYSSFYFSTALFNFLVSFNFRTIVSSLSCLAKYGIFSRPSTLFLSTSQTMETLYKYSDFLGPSKDQVVEFPPLPPRLATGVDVPVNSLSKHGRVTSSTACQVISDTCCSWFVKVVEEYLMASCRRGVEGG